MPIVIDFNDMSSLNYWARLLGVSMERQNSINRRARRLNNVAHIMCREAAALLVTKIREHSSIPGQVEVEVADIGHASYPAADVFQVQVRHCVERLLQTSGIEIVATQKDGHVHVACVLPR